MNVTAVLAEIVIIGITANLGLLFIMLGFGGSLSNITALVKDMSAILFVFFIGFSYFTGNLINTLSHIIFDKSDKKIRQDVLKDKSEQYQQIRLKIYKASDELKSFLDVRYSILRLFRSSVISFLILGIGFMIWRPTGLTITQFWLILALLIAFIVFSFLAFKNQTKIFYKIVLNLNSTIDNDD